MNFVVQNSNSTNSSETISEELDYENVYLQKKV